MYSRNHALGMSYVNRFVIEEESQFECDGVYGWDVLNIQHIAQQIARHSYRQLHVFISADFLPDRGFQNFRHWDKFLKKFNAPNHIVTFIGSERLECVQKEEYKKFYKGEGQIRYYSNDSPLYTVLDVRESIGDEIEDFSQRIKMKKIAFDSNKYHSSGYWGYNTILELHWAVKNFHISMLTDERQNKMLLQQSSGRKCPDFKNDTKLFENAHNYALSICIRKTFFENEQIYYEIIDSDSAALTTSLNVERYLRNITRRKIPTTKKRPGRKVQTDKEEKANEATPKSDSDDEDEAHEFRWT